VTDKRTDGQTDGIPLVTLFLQCTVVSAALRLNYFYSSYRRKKRHKKIKKNCSDLRAELCAAAAAAIYVTPPPPFVRARRAAATADNFVDGGVTTKQLNMATCASKTSYLLAVNL